MRTYTAWSRGKGQKTEVLTECKAGSAKDFKAIVEKAGATITSRIRIKKT